jgi:two-component system LytT family sensor kinase
MGQQTKEYGQRKTEDGKRFSQTFADIYRRKMRTLIRKQHIRFYGWAAAAYLTIGLLDALTNHPDEFGRRALNEIWLDSYIVFFVYRFLEHGLPRLNAKKIGSAVLLVSGYIFLFSFGAYAWRSFGITLHVFTDIAQYINVGKAVSAQFGNSIGALLFFGIIRHIYNHIKLKRDAQRLRIEKQEAELNYLKSQTNPHFLFNTLNNIYSLARDKDNQAPEAILRLSKILRFMLYEAGGEYISVEQELKIIADYISLEKLRYDESLRVNFNHDIEDMRQSLPPLLLLPLVENAFKHGVSETRNRPFVDIHLSVNKRQLLFTVRNSTEEPQAQQKLKENIGLSNLKRQLVLLYTDHELSAEQGDYVFTANLKINLASHVKNKMYNSGR